MKIDLSNLPNNIPPAFRPILTYQGRYLVPWGGAGSGKSVTVAKKWIARTLVNPKHKILCCRKVNSVVEKSVVAQIAEILGEWGVPFRTKQKPFYTFILPGGGQIVCAGFDDPEKIKSIPGITGIWFEEATEFDLNDFLQANLRLRGDTPSYKQFTMTFNPIIRTNWIHEEMFSCQNADIEQGLKQVVETKHHDGEDVMFHHSTYHDNPFLDAAYSNILAGLAKSSPLYFQVYEKGLWGRLEGTVYYSFGPHNIDPEIELQPGPVLWAHDFNIGEGKPMSSCLCQNGKRDGREVLNIFDEIIIDGVDTHSVINEFKERYPGIRDVVIYGDAAGKARDTRSKTTDYQILRDAGFVRQDVPRSNPSVRDRHNAVNARLKAADETVSVYIHPRCKTVIRGLESVTLKKGASYIEEETRDQHVTTALGYLISRRWPVKKWKSSGQKYWK